ncbi:FhaA domain-containing protein [Dactylosporangium sp. CA-092794]|uniref:FhaA domain-containing protein n=1 Tax=Dactylosporangium sp. CA-092794 TaxID=3239929 RepID=UPI003D8DA963
MSEEAIRQAMRREADVGEQTLAPNRYLLLVAPADHADVRDRAAALAGAQAAYLAEQGWSVCDEVVVEVFADDTVEPGSVRVEAEVRKGRTSPADEAGRGVGLRMNDGRRYTVQSGATVIGRGRQADLRLRDEGVSRRHACLQYDGTALTVRDLGSTNGTTVNDRPLRGAVPLSPGDTIGVGPVTLTVEAARHPE